jgi:hypothetical protein
VAIAFGASLGTASDGGVTGTTQTVTTTATVPSGGRVVIVTGWFSVGTTASASGGSLTWVNDGVFVNTTTASYHSAILSADCPSGLASSTVLTVTFSATSDNKTVSCFYITGAVSGASGYLDGAAVGGSGTITGWATASLTTTNANDILIAGGYIDKSTSDTPGASFTEIHDVTAAGSGVTYTSEYRVISGGGGGAVTPKQLAALGVG